MAGIKQLGKLLTDDPVLNRVQEHLVSQLNPTLRALPQMRSFRLFEVDGVNGAPPTLALQYAGQGGTWTTIFSFHSDGTTSAP